MSESADYSPGNWSGHDFADARKSYDSHAKKSLSAAVAASKKHTDLAPKSLSTNSPSPLVIVCDVTGSMGEWPATMFSKLPYLEHEAKDYLGKGTEISFAAVGDANSDNYPLQARFFTKDTALAESLKELVIEGGGGGSGEESYELAALYYARNVEMPKAIHKPIIIFIGDEALYSHVNKSQAKEFAYVDLGEKMSVADVFAELKKKYSVYLIQKPYGDSSVDGDSLNATTRANRAQWAKVVGNDHIALLPEAGRVVDVIFGILAKESDRIEDFKEEIEGRQEPGQVKTVYKSLATIHALPAKVSSPKALPGGSRMHKSSDGGTKKK